MIVRYEHHGVEVSVQQHLKGRHREHCLCFHGCRAFKPHDGDNCPKAQMLYEFDVKHGMTTPVFECPDYDGVELD